MSEASDHLPPSGIQHEVRSGGQRAVVCEVGATLRSYSAGGAEILDGFGIGEPAADGRGQVLAPWPNRLDAGRYEFEGVVGLAALDEPEAGNAIHGLVRWLPWEPVARSTSSITLTCVLHPQPGYPWRLRLVLEYALGRDGLTVEARAANLSGDPAPFGIGFHPYLSTSAPSIDEAHVTIPGSRRLTADARGLPTGEEAVAGSAFDFTAARLVGSTALDTCFTDLSRGDDGRSSVRLAGAGRNLTVWADEAFRYLMAYTGDTLEPASRRRRSIALEPMTCPPNALRSGIDVIRLEPGADWQGRWGITPG